jgi:outer membrane protein assembly factor BamB/tetratricopeptide (TPR) repeat protein
MKFAIRDVAMTAEEFVDQLEQSDLLPQDVVAKIRKQIGAARRPVSPKAVAKWLVDKGHLTTFQVKRLLPEEPPKEQEPAEESQAKEPAEDDLGLAPLEEEEKKKAPTPRKESSPTKKKTEPVPAEGSAAAQAADIVEEELSPLDALDAMDEAALDAGDPLLPTTKKKKGLKKLLSLPKSDEPEIEAHEEPKSRDARTRNLIAVVSGIFVGLLMLAGVIFWALNRTSCKERLLLADESYEDEDYPEAIKRYNDFLSSCPNHESASFARVRRALAGLRLKVDGTSDFEAALVAAQDTIKAIKDEDEFPRAQAELASLLPRIAKGLAEGAQELAESDPTAAQLKVDRFDEAMLLVNNRDYVPDSVRNVSLIEKIDILVSYVRKDINRDAELSKALKAIDAAIAQGQPDEAYKVRARLLKDYPDLEHDKRLIEKVMEIAAAEKDRIRVTPLGAKASTEEPTSQVLSATALVSTRPGQLGEELGKAPVVDGRVVFALAEGAAYGLDATTGTVLWRRFVGFDTQMMPVAIGLSDGGSGTDALLVDSVRNEVVRVSTRSGRLVWRHPVDEAFDGEPLMLGDQILVATESGRLLTLDAKTGDALFSAMLPQQLRTQPGGDPRKEYVYQVGEHSNLYVMSLRDGKCHETRYLGHGLGSVTVPPLVVQRYVMVVENRGLEFSYLHVLKTDFDGLSLKPMQKLRIEGRVNVPLVKLGGRGRFMLITDRGEMRVYGPPGQKNPTRLTLVADQAAIGERPLVYYPLERQGDLWLASDQLLHYDIGFTTKRFQLKDRLHPGETFTQPMQALGDVLVHARRQPGTPGVIVSAVDMEKGGRGPAANMIDYWQTTLGAPPAAAPHVADDRVVAATANGSVYEIPLDGAPSIALPLAMASAPPNHAPLVDRVDLGQGRAVYSPGPGGRHVLRYDARATSARAAWVPLELPDGDSLGSLPVALAGGLLAPGTKGQVYLLNAANGRWQAAPLQAKQRSVNGQFAWRRPDTTSPDSTQAVVSDGHTKLYVLDVKSEPEPHLVIAATSAELDARITSPVALIGNTVYALDAGGILHSMKLPGLSDAMTIDVGAPAVWGPQRVGQRVLLTTGDHLVCLADDEQRLQWQVELPPHFSLAGAPIALNTDNGNDFLIVSTDGVISRIDGSTGEELAAIELNQPLGSGAILHEGQLFVLTRDGSLLRTPLPK